MLFWVLLYCTYVYRSQALKPVTIKGQFFKAIFMFIRTTSQDALEAWFHFNWSYFDAFENEPTLFWFLIYHTCLYRSQALKPETIKGQFLKAIFMLIQTMSQEALEAWFHFNWSYFDAFDNEPTLFWVLMNCTCVHRNQALKPVTIKGQFLKQFLCLSEQCIKLLMKHGFISIDPTLMPLIISLRFFEFCCTVLMCTGAKLWNL